MYFAEPVQQAGSIGKFYHFREIMSIDKQTTMLRTDSPVYVNLCAEHCRYGTRDLATIEKKCGNFRLADHILGTVTMSVGFLKFSEPSGGWLLKALSAEQKEGGAE